MGKKHYILITIIILFSGAIITEWPKVKQRHQEQLEVDKSRVSLYKEYYKSY
jgi:hypothetical protein